MKNLKDFNQDTNSDSKTTECKRLKMRFLRKAEHLLTLESRLDDLLDDFETDSSELYNISELIKSTRQDISRLQNEMQKLGCQKEKPAQVTYDNQTVISTSSVRRKNSKALEKTAKPNVQIEN
jgi:hypothetical protein